VSLLPPGNIRVRFFVPEPVIGALHTGQSVKVKCDGCGAPMTATVSYIAPNTEFTPPVIYSKDSRAKLVFMIEAVPGVADATRLKPGQPVDVTL
jgi:HlyD family secretion protein